MKILIACEYSGVVRDAFTANGHDAESCDLLPSDAPGKHVQGDALALLNDIRYAYFLNLLGGASPLHVSLQFVRPLACSRRRN